ncbi:MAG TPA: DUF2294 domain-containing protein [Spirochaetota bacterium]|nr:DUF2294 domain-containing protein [Spirochaetota bacterium]
MTKGQIEAQISEAIIKFEKEYMGRGPTETKTFIINDMIIVRLKGVLTPAEVQLSKTRDGADLVKKTRVRLLESARYLLENIVNNITSKQVISLHSDISTKIGERVIIFIMNGNLEEKDI